MVEARFSITSAALLILFGAVGCQSGAPVENQRLIQHQALIDFSGLKPVEVAEAVRVEASLPSSWSLHAVEKHALFNHQQWKSPSAKTAVGVIYSRLPLPLTADMLLWIGSNQYSKSADNGHEIGRWTDELGRRWFEAETTKYHCRGYAIVSGLDAWIVYLGYKVDATPEPSDIGLGLRCMETFVPVHTGDKLRVIPVQSAPLTSPSQTQPTSRPSAEELKQTAKKAMSYLSNTLSGAATQK